MGYDWKRYSCQIALPGFDRQAQQKLKNAKVLIAGAGGLGCPSAQYLVSSGIGHVSVADFDTVSVSNLHRQILYNTGDVGRLKAEVACERLSKMNEDVTLDAIPMRLTHENVLQLIDRFDIVVDCTDNFETRYLLNDACVMRGKPLVYGAIYQFEGQVAVWNVRNEDGTMSPNYRDVFPEVHPASVPSCSDGGVLPPVAGVIGCMMATEVIKLLTGVGEVMSGKLFIFDGADSRSRIISIGNISKVRITSLEKTMPVKLVTASELSEMLEGNSVQLIDVREEHERRKFNIGGIHVPLDAVEKISLPPSDTRIVVYCQSGRRSELAAGIINRKFPGVEAYSLRGGMNEWDVLFNVSSR